ncbi:unnamed protein product [Durusdinium trenchii]|uniref:Uncharacterized protein n=2 Tax=Durusdinium trenchii TaxID=1381693 RepID=A0ABP0KAP6_9DINO
MFWIWRPMGNLPALEVEYDQMRSRVEVATITDGDPEDLFVWPLPASLFQDGEWDVDGFSDLSIVWIFKSPGVFSQVRSVQQTTHQPKMLTSLWCLGGCRVSNVTFLARA